MRRTINYTIKYDNLWKVCANRFGKLNAINEICKLVLKITNNNNISEIQGRYVLY